jgi:hypothetical protein
MWAQLTFAESIQIPELGVYMPDAPAGLAVPRVSQYIDGSRASLAIGTAHLLIARLEAEVPAGSDVRERAYRAAQREYFHDNLGAQGREQATMIGGRDSWTMATAVRSAQGASVRYRSITYVIFQQHFYRLEVHATGVGTKPPDYSSALTALSRLTFAPIERSGTPVAPAGLLSTPVFHGNSSKPYYPAALSRRGVQGIVDLEFSIDDHGRAYDVRQTYADSENLGEAAEDELRAGTFNIYEGWKEKGYSSVRLNIEFQYRLTENRKPSDALDADTRIPDVELVLISAPRP